MARVHGGRRPNEKAKDFIVPLKSFAFSFGRRPDEKAKDFKGTMKYRYFS